MTLRAERVAALEAMVNEHSHAVATVRGSMLQLEQRIDQRMDRIDVRLDRVEGRLDRLDDKVSRQFVWLVSLQVTILLAMVGSLVSVAVLVAP